MVGWKAELTRRVDIYQKETKHTRANVFTPFPTAKKLPLITPPPYRRSDLFSTPYPSLNDKCDISFTARQAPHKYHVSRVEFLFQSGK